MVVCSLDDPELTLTYIMAMANLAPWLLYGEKVKTMDFSGTIIDFVMKLAAMGHNDKRYLLTDINRGSIWPWPRAIYMYDITRKKVYKISSKRFL